MAASRTALGVDVGGTGIKAGIVDVDAGALIGPRRRIPTPESRLPAQVIPAIAELIQAFSYDGPVGIGFPSVVRDGRPLTPFTAYQVREWVGRSVVDELTRLGCAVVAVVNDADAAGLAELRSRPPGDFAGTVLLFTLGTGIGSALFLNGCLIPNLELGHLFLQGHAQVAESYASERCRIEDQLTWPAYAARVQTYLQHIERLFSPQRILLGGGVDLHHPEFLPNIQIATPLFPAKLGKDAGIIGAGIAAWEHRLP